ncbi:MAG: hypothetical protein H0X07_00340 [Gemmatimonadales bacterium]|nr:hypothetical protein [Gemmatimonadales bacterium]
MIISTSTNRAPAAGRARAELGIAKSHPLDARAGGYAKETELSKLIRYGCQFELEIHQMAELNQMRAENINLRAHARSVSPGPEAGTQPKPSLALHQ